MSTKEKLIEALQEFTQYTVETFETRIILFRNVLEEKDKSSPDTSVSDAAASSVKFATDKIPLIGAVLSTISGFTTEKAVLYFQKKYSKKDASALCKIAYSTKDIKKLDEYKKILIEVCFMLFYSYERQLMNTTTETGGKTRAMMKLAHYVVNTILLYIIANEDDEDDTDELFTTEKLIEAILTEKNIARVWIDKIKLKFKDSPLPDADRTITLRINEKPKTSSALDFFTKVGVQIEENNRYYLYSTAKQEPEEYGYRRCFDFDDKTTIESYENKIITDPERNYILRSGDKDDEVDSLFLFLENRDPKKMEIRIKRVIKDSSDGIEKVLVSLYGNVNDIKTDLAHVRSYLDNNGDRLLKVLVDHHTAHMRRFDDAQQDRDVKHQEVMDRFNKISGSNPSGGSIATAGASSSLVPLGNFEVVPATNSASNMNFEGVIGREKREFLNDFKNDF